MENQTGNGTFSRPLMWMAGIAITLFCATGIAAIMGWIPSSMGKADDSAVISSTEKNNGAHAFTSQVKAPQAPAQTQRPASRAAPAASPEKAASCMECGVVESSRQVSSKGEGSGLGVIGGAVVGGLLGNQVGAGRGKDIATVAGAVGGGVAGNEIEKRMKSTVSSEVTVRMQDGSSRIVHEGGAATWKNGDKVRIVDGAIRAG